MCCRAGQAAHDEGVRGDIEDFCRAEGLSEAFLRLFLRPMAGVRPR